MFGRNSCIYRFINDKIPELFIGKAVKPSFDTLSRLVKPLGLSLAEMFRDSEDVSYLNSNERELVECYRMLSDERAEKLLQFLKTLV